MFPEQSILRIPGPTPLPPSVLSALQRPMIGHRGEEITALVESIQQRLKPLFGTNEDVLLIAGTGTSALEASVVNTVSAGDEVLVLVTGSFGDRFAKICREFGMIVRTVDVTWGEAVHPEDVVQALKTYPHIKAVFMTHCETSTGVLNPVESLSKTIREQTDALIIVDGVSSVGGTPTYMDDWGVDIYVSGSQKALMAPAGLACVAVSERAWETIENNDTPRFYFDFLAYRKAIQNNYTPFTAAISLLYALDASLALIDKEGVNEVYRRHELLRNMTRSAAEALNLPLFSEEEFGAYTVTTIQPRDVDADELRAFTHKNFGLQLAGGQQHMAGKLIRIGHMGFCTPADTLQVVSILEIGLEALGKSNPKGSGVAAAQSVFLRQELNI
ncbi:MAG TPA: alanine--glyoxylate aminotransferase family protein [Bacillota bacterium]|nr:alanine--glyoxylate aminotransferase family protein [Bacillota bacterium]